MGNSTSQDEDIPVIALDPSEPNPDHSSIDLVPAIEAVKELIDQFESIKLQIDAKTVNIEALENYIAVNQFANRTDLLKKEQDLSIMKAEYERVKEESTKVLNELKSGLLKIADVHLSTSIDILISQLNMSPNENQLMKEIRNLKQELTAKEDTIKKQNVHLQTIHGKLINTEKKEAEKVTNSKQLLYQETSQGSEKEPIIRIFVINSSGKQISFDLKETDTIRSLKKKIQEIDGTPGGMQRLIYAGRELENHRTLFDHNIRNDSKIHLVRRIVGGGTDGGRPNNYNELNDFW